MTICTIDEAYGVFNPETPLAYGDERYVDISDVRGIINFARTIASRIKRSKPPEFHYQLVTGHRGCGKSTELLQLQGELKKMKYFTVYMDVMELLDLGDIKYQDVLMAIVRALVDGMEKEDKASVQALLANLENWFAEKVRIRQEVKDESLSVGTDLEAGVPWLIKLKALFSAKIKFGRNEREEFRQVLNKTLTEFSEALNLLIDVVRQKVREDGYEDIVIIVDSLEKMLFKGNDDGTSNHFELFIQNAEQLKLPNCHIIYTVPIWLSFHAQLGDAYSETPYGLPMVKYRTEEGKKKLFETVSKRADVKAIFEEEQIIYDFIAMSGGSHRDLFRMIRMACDGVDDMIRKEDAKRAVDALINDYDRLLREEDVEKLVLVEKEKRVPTPTGYDWLLNRRLIHEYQNGERWADLHPAISRQLHRKYGHLYAK